MSTYYTRKTPDYSPLAVHFTREPDRRMVGDVYINDSHPLFPYKNKKAIERLINILESNTIHASPMPFLPSNREAVCFTECPWNALIGHAERYSPYGVVFSKRLIFEKGGGPALYIRGDIQKLTQQNIPKEIVPFLAPFDPDGVMNPPIKLDWLHEREWRLPKSLVFDWKDIEYVIVESTQDVNTVVEDIGAQHIPRHKFIAMDIYRTIQKAWSINEA